MEPIVLKIRTRKEYEAKLAECLTPIRFIGFRFDSYHAGLNEVANGMSQPVYEYFSGYGYWSSIAQDIIFPLLKAFVLITKRHICECLLFQDENSLIPSPCSYTEAFDFFKGLNEDDVKTIFHEWTTPSIYVTLIDCLERNDVLNFTTEFALIDNSIDKLRCVSKARRMLSELDSAEKSMTFISMLEKAKNNDSSESLDLDSYRKSSNDSGYNELTSGYDWSQFDEFCNCLEEYFIEVYPSVINQIRSLKQNRDLKNFYEYLVYPCFRAKDFSNADDVAQATLICSRVAPSKIFSNFWKDVAHITLGVLSYIIYNGKILSIYEQDVISRILENSTVISPQKLRAVIWFYKGRIARIRSSSQKTLSSELNNLPDELLQGKQYFEEAMKMGLIIKDGDHLKWVGKTKVLLSYFCARIFCGDYSKKQPYSGQKSYWTTEGGGVFPEKELNELFNQKDLSQPRRNAFNKNTASPKGHNLIDEIIEAVRSKA